MNGIIITAIICGTILALAGGFVALAYLGMKYTNK